MMKPILFSTPMVQAILADQKTMTRRVIKAPENAVVKNNHLVWYNHEIGQDTENYPKYRVGDILWVRETCWKGFDNKYHFKADYLLGTKQMCKEIKILPSIFMPREAARIFLRVTDVRVERVQDITEEDAIAEGCKAVEGATCQSFKDIEANIPPHEFGARDDFAGLWNNLNAKRGYGWDTNPWVWVIVFSKINESEVKKNECGIDH